VANGGLFSFVTIGDIKCINTGASKPQSLNMSSNATKVAIIYVPILSLKTISGEKHKKCQQWITGSQCAETVNPICTSNYYSMMLQLSADFKRNFAILEKLIKLAVTGSETMQQMTHTNKKHHKL